MLKSIKSIIGSRVVDFADSSTLGEVVDWVIAPESKKITAFLVRPAGWFAKLAAVPSLAVIEYGPKLLIVKDPEALRQPQEIMSNPKSISQKIHLLGSPVITSKGRKLGLAEDLLFETSDTTIQKLYITPDLINKFHQPDLIITANRIVNILPNKIVVEEDGAETSRVQQIAESKA